MALDVLSVMQVGVLLSALTVLFLAQAGQHFPAERRRHLRIWTVGLLLHPMAWAMLALRGQLPGDSGTDATARPGDQRCASLKIQIHRVLLHGRWIRPLQCMLFDHP